MESNQEFDFVNQKPTKNRPMLRSEGAWELPNYIPAPLLAASTLLGEMEPESLEAGEVDIKRLLKFMFVMQMVPKHINAAEFWEMMKDKDVPFGKIYPIVAVQLAAFLYEGKTTVPVLPREKFNRYEAMLDQQAKEKAKEKAEREQRGRGGRGHGPRGGSIPEDN